MAIDSDWVADVKRWCLAEAHANASAAAPESDRDAELGYEAAHPALQSRHWPDAPNARCASPD